MLYGTPAEPSPEPTILIVEDDAALRVLLTRGLREHGFNALSAPAPAEMWRTLKERSVDLILLDLMLPGGNGLDICRTLRRDSNVPIIILSALGSEVDRVLGLELGADDYLPKPFSTKELMARIRAVLRRGAVERAPTSECLERIKFEGWTLDLRRHELFAPNEAKVELSGAEFAILVVLLDNAQRIIGRDRLLELSRSRIGESSDRSVDVLISRLRRKLQQGDNGVELIRTIRGVGYMMVPKAERF